MEKNSTHRIENQRVSHVGKAFNQPKINELTDSAIFVYSSFGGVCGVVPQYLI